MAEAELGGSALPSMGRREKGMETDDEHFLFPWCLGRVWKTKGRRKAHTRYNKGCLHSISLVNNGNCIYLRAQLFFCDTKLNCHFHASY